MWVPAQPLRDIITDERVLYLDTFYDPQEKQIVTIVEKENGETVASFNVDAYIEEWKILDVPNPYLTPLQSQYLKEHINGK